MSGANYNGRQPNNTAYIKTFVLGSLATTNFWKNSTYIDKNVLTPANASSDLYIPGNIIVGGEIIYDKTNKVNNQDPSENEMMQLKNEISQLKVEMTHLKNLYLLYDLFYWYHRK